MLKSISHRPPSTNPPDKRKHDLYYDLPKRPRKRAPSHVSIGVKDMIIKALELRGGVSWLSKIHETNFVKLLTMVIPREIAHSGVVTGVAVSINSNVNLGYGAPNNREFSILQDQSLPETTGQELVKVTGNDE